MEILREKRYLGMLGNVLILVGTFLPLMTITVSFLGVSQSQSLSYIQAGAPAYITILCTIASLLMVFSDFLESKVPFFGKFQNQKLTLIPTGISAALLILNVMNYSSSNASALISSLGKSTWAIGFWVMIVGFVVAAVYPFLYKGSNKQA